MSFKNLENEMVRVENRLALLKQDGRHEEHEEMQNLWTYGSQLAR